MATTNALSTVVGFTKYLGLFGTIPSLDNTARDNPGTGDNSTTVFWLDRVGVLEGTYTISYGASEASLTALTETTHYTLDLSNSKLTLTASGVTAVSTNKIYAEYSYNTAGLLNSELIDALNYGENRVLRETEQVFVDSTVTAPAYREVSDERIFGHFTPEGKVFDFKLLPAVKIQTTVNGAFTLTDTTLTLTDASLLPATGTIYVGGNKVTYTAKSSNDLTVPNTTPSIADGATVRGEVVELSSSPEGTAPSYSVLDPDTEYDVDYNQGRVKVLSNAFFGEISQADRIYPSNYLLRVSYFQAWHEPDKDSEIPDEIEWVVNALAARKISGSIVNKATISGLNEFNPGLINVDKDAIWEVLEHYKTLNVGTSYFNRQSLS